MPQPRGTREAGAPAGAWRSAGQRTRRGAGARYRDGEDAAPRRKYRQDSAVGANRRDLSLSPEFQGGVTTDHTPSDGMDPSPTQPASVGPSEFAMVDPSHRTAVVASLDGTLSRAVAFGDAEAARVVHEAIGRLLGLEPEGRASSRR